MGARIRQLRKDAGYPAHDKFAYTHNMIRSQYVNYERGADMYFSTLMRILEMLDITPAEFFSEGFEVEDEADEM
ncbi:MAG: helix-turn-helix domain-containing protein [Saprospiraceae bacterium]